MNWFVFAAVCTIGWGAADLFYKKGTDEADRFSHLKIAVWVGFVMGVCAFALMPFAESHLSPAALLADAVRYAPASLCYIISMIIGYAGLRYLELSIVSPVQNASGALSAVVMLVYFAACGRSILDELSVLDVIGTVIIVLAVLALAVVEQQLSDAHKAEHRYRFGALALLFPLLYCLFDTLGTAADGIILDEETGLGLGETDVLILYGLTFFAAGIVSYIVMWIRTGKPYNPFAKSELSKAAAAVCEQFGQVFYVFAMASRPVLAAPMIASYCIVSVILSRVFLREKLKISQYACVIAVIIGIVLLGISEGLAEV